MLGDVLGNSPKKHVDYKQFKTNNDGVASARDAAREYWTIKYPIWISNLWPWDVTLKVEEQDKHDCVLS